MANDSGRARSNRDARGETEYQQVDRNWENLLQELRVTQTGVQLLTGFLLTLPFQARFEGLGSWWRTVYLVTTLASIGATILLVAPVAMHRVLFRRNQLRYLVEMGERLALIGLALLGAALVGALAIVFDAVAGPRQAVVAGSAAAVMTAALWFGLPWKRRAGRGSR